MKTTYIASFCLGCVCCCSHFLAIPAFAARETWECNYGKGNLPQALSIEVDDGKLVRFQYTGMAPSADGDTYYTCTVEAVRGAPENIWRDKSDSIEVRFKEGIAPDDHVIIRSGEDRFDFELEMSPSNCGHSTPIAARISIGKGKKHCLGVHIDS